MLNRVRVLDWEPRDSLLLSEGEIHFLWSFMDGSIMIPETRARLRRAWGMCARHSFGWLALEATFRPHFLHGPALLYEDLLERAVHAFAVRGPLTTLRLKWRLRARGPCLMCDLGYGPESRGMPSAAVLARSRDLREIRSFVEAGERWWRADLCGVCAGSGAWPRCRPHLLLALSRRGADIAAQRELATRIAHHVTRFSRSFRWELRGTATPADRASLVSAVGWCSGWQAWLRLMAH